MKKSKKIGIVARFVSLLCVVFAIFAGGYFFLDKLIVPKYFGRYGIKGVGDLVGVVTSLYKTPNESKFVTNAYTEEDFTVAIQKLQDSGYLIADDGSIIEEDGRGFQGGEVKLTDREFAAVCNKLLANNILADTLPNLQYLNIINISLKQITVKVNEESKVENFYESARLGLIAKIETDDIREQISVQMDTPISLLRMIIPDVIYFEISYDVDLTKPGIERISNGVIAINSRTVKQSEILINLLIDFIFPEEDEMDIEKFTATLGDVVLEGIDLFGEFRFVNNLGKSKNQSGFYVS